MSVPRETGAQWRSVVSRETEGNLDIVLGLLKRWNQHINLVSQNDVGYLESRHLADSLALLAFIPQGVRRAIDLGSGAGFPGLILAMASGIHFDLIEADQRKAAFLAEAARATRAPVRVVNSRIEDADCNPTQLITSRALAPLNQLLAYAVPLLTSDGICLFPKGRNVQGEIDLAAQTWRMTIVRQSSLSSDGTILQISQISRA